MQIDHNTEEKILNAAREVFLEKGFYGARMQEIADMAGINKALLHYYFRSKDKLFLKIFEEAIRNFMPKIGSIMLSELPFWDKIRMFIESYINLIIENPFLPLFIMKEISRNPDMMQNIVIDKLDGIFAIVSGVIKSEIKAGVIKDVDPRQFVMNIAAMCIFPFAGKPIMKILFKCSEEEFAVMMNERKTLVYNVIYSWLKP